MDCAKPEIAVLGDATLVILGRRQVSQELPPNQMLASLVADSELDD